MAPANVFQMDLAALNLALESLVESELISESDGIRAAILLRGLIFHR